MDRRFEALARASLRVHAAPAVDDVLATLAAEARALFDADVALARIDEAGADARTQTSHSAEYPTLASIPDDGLAWIEAPMAGAGEWSGLLKVAAPIARPLRPEDTALLTCLAQTGALAVDNARSLRAAREASHLRDNLLAIVSHDLRNHLNTLAMSTALLRDDVAPRGIAFVDRIQRAVGRMNRVLADLVDASSLEEGSLQVSVRREEAAPIVRESIEGAESAAAARGCRVEADIADEDAWVLADRDRLLQVLANLLGNAVRSSPAGGVVTVGLGRNGEMAVFSVRNEGPGIDAEPMHALLAARSKLTALSRDGRGLGLFIARGIVEAHQGTLRLESPSAGGTRFVFTVPLVRPL